MNKLFLLQWNCKEIVGIEFLSYNCKLRQSKKLDLSNLNFTQFYWEGLRPNLKEKGFSESVYLYPYSVRNNSNPFTRNLSPTNLMQCCPGNIVEYSPSYHSLEKMTYFSERISRRVKIVWSQIFLCCSESWIASWA